MIFLFIALGCVVVVLLFASIADWAEYTDKKYGAKLKFSAFKKFYNINPTRWIPLTGYVQCMVPRLRGFGHEIICFHFGYIDYIKYRLWCKKQDKREVETMHAKSMAKMIVCVREDIKNIELLAQKELEQARCELKRIQN